jgi:hypothetical protein
LPLGGYLKGEEALIDIQFLFQTNNQQTVNTPTNTPNTTMSVFLRPLNFLAIQVAPHQVSEKAIDKLPTFQGNNAISAESHILNFQMCVERYCRGHNDEDVKMTLFVYSLEGDVDEWFTDFDSASLAPLIQYWMNLGRDGVIKRNIGFSLLPSPLAIRKRMKLWKIVIPDF